MYARGSGLHTATFTPPMELAQQVGAVRGLAHDAATWINRCCMFYGVSARWVLMVCQAEQSLALDPLPRSPVYRVQVEVPEPGKKLEDPGARAFLSRGRIVRLESGDYKMACACGAGIPDPSADAPWSVENYLGFDRQVYHCARLARRDLDGYARGLREVVLYGGERVSCADPLAYVLLQWTPSEKVLSERLNIYSRMFPGA
jgi:hypothetical protein